MSLKTLSIQKRNIALEALTVTDLQNSLQRIFPKMVDNLKGFLGTFSPTAPGLELKANEAMVKHLLSKANYLDIESLLIPIPEGMAVSYPEYLETLAKASDFAKEVQVETLNKISTYLALLISDPNRRFDSQGISRELSARENKREELTKLMAEQTDDSSTKNRRPYGELVQRNADWDKVFADFRDVARTLNSIDRKKLNAKIAECVTYLDTIINKLKRNELEGVSPEVVKSLGEAIYQAGRDVEFISLVFFRAVSCGQALNGASNDIIKMLK